MLITNSQADATSKRYDVPSELKEDFTKSRKKKDKAGNNSCHYAFAIGQDEKTNAYTKRWKFIRLLSENKVGDMNEPNTKG